MLSFFFFKQKTAYEIRPRDWSSDVCSSDLRIVSRLILWRHGNTDWNAAHRVQGQTDVPLNALGLRQAADVAVKLAPRNPTLLISSDSSRAARTADALADITGLVAQRDPRLRERAFGLWET